MRQLPGLITKTMSHGFREIFRFCIVTCWFLRKGLRKTGAENLITEPAKPHNLPPLLDQVCPRCGHGMLQRSICLPLVLLLLYDGACSIMTVTGVKCVVSNVDF